MNRIRDLRSLIGLSADDLASRVGTSAVQIRRLEQGTRRLTVDWMERIAAALECAPSDLLGSELVRQARDDVEPTNIELPGVAAAIKIKGLTVYRVLTDAVSDLGIAEDSIITVDEAVAAILQIQSGDIVLLRATTPPAILLRQFIKPALAITNRRSNHVVLRTDSDGYPLAVCGVVVRG